MIKKIDLYIIKKFLGTYVFAIALIISIVVVFDVNEKLDALLKAPLKATVFDYYLNFIPYFVSLFSPLFTFISVIFFTSKLADNSEIIAMLASGCWFPTWFRPVSSQVLIFISTVILFPRQRPPESNSKTHT